MAEEVEAPPPLTQEWKTERLERYTMAAQVTGYGNAFLDDALVGIFPNDLILMGAATGLGKTHFATQVALHQARQGRNVVFFALEADRWEIQRRMKYQALTQIYYTHYQGTFPWPRYSEWLAQGYDADFERLEERVEKELALQTDGLRIVYRGEKFSSEDFVQVMSGQIAEEANLIIVDHLHYFDYEDANENLAIKRAVKAIRDRSIHLSKPILLLAHLRKEERKNPYAIPTLEDFHGSSDIGKIATVGIMMAPAEQAEGMEGVHPTYFHIAKCRRDGPLKKYVGLMSFNLREGRYGENYYVGKYQKYQTPELITDGIPKWLKRARRYGLPATPIAQNEARNLGKRARTHREHHSKDD